MKYVVELAVTGHYRVYVDAESEAEAKNLAIEEFEDADFGELEEIECEINSVDPLND